MSMTATALTLAALMFSTGITDGELEEAEYYDDEFFYAQSDCEAVADYLQRMEDNSSNPGYFFCLTVALDESEVQ